ncbi:HNH endonuclease [Neobacillus niacini]|uniref:HNH endonuclease n=1 Tax=Neobacillus niacini TaxID=86668 RepID=UPI0030005AC0
MKNDFEVRGDHVVIFLKRKNGTILETKVSLCDLPLLHNTNATFCPTWNQDTESFYVNYHIFNSLGKKSKRSLHRLIMNCPTNKIVDHINHDTLDNRRENLRIVNNSQSMQNVKGTRKDNKSGYKNVSWHKLMKKWRVRLNINKQEITIGYFDDVHEAGKSALEARRMLYTHAPENREREELLSGNSF